LNHGIDNGSGKNEPDSKKPWRSLKKKRYAEQDYGPDYDRRYSGGLNELNTMVEQRWIESHLGGGLILDAGAGTGRFAAALQDVARTIVALDSSAPMLASVHEKAPELALIHSDIYSIPAAENTFDGVVCMHVLFHLPDWPEVLKELARVVRPGGPVIFEMRSGDHVRLAQKVLKLFRLEPGRRKSGNRSQHTVYARRSEVRNAMQNCGLALEKAFPYDIGHAYYLAPLTGALEKLLAASKPIKAAAALCEMFLGPLFSRFLTYRTLYLGRKI